MPGELTSVVGLVPAAGRAKRIAPLPCSKEIFPVGFRRDAQGDVRPRVASRESVRQVRPRGRQPGVCDPARGEVGYPGVFR